MIEGYGALICIKDLPEGYWSTSNARSKEITSYHLSHFMAGLPMSPLSCFGREPPESATVNLPFFSTDSFCALAMNAVSAGTSSAAEGNEYTIGVFGEWCMTLAKNSRLQLYRHRSDVYNKQT